MIQKRIQLSCWILLLCGWPLSLACAQENAVKDETTAIAPALADPKLDESTSVETDDQSPGVKATTSEFGVSSKEPAITKWKVGAKIHTGNGRASNLLLTFPVPADWPEQSVTVLEETIPTEIGNVQPRKLDSGVQQIMVKCPVVGANERVEISYTLEIRNRSIVAPRETQFFTKPKSSGRVAKPFLVASRNVNYKNGKLRKQAKKIVAGHESPWDQANAIYDWVRKSIGVAPTQFHSATHTLKNKSGTNEDKTFLFVAMCRAVKIPARIVFAKDLAYAEFMLLDPKDEKPHWFPCNVTGVREFGGLSEPRVILQKGDGIRVPEKSDPQKYVAEFVTCEGQVRPRIGFFRAEIFEDDEEAELQD
jgi:hypothetical protein